MQAEKRKNYNIPFSLLEGCHYFAVLVFNGLYSTFLLDFGYGESFVGIVLTSIGLSCIVLQPLLGFLADKTGKVKQMVLLITLLLTAALPLLFKFSQSRAFVIAFSVVVIGAAQSSVGLVDSWVAKLGRQNYRLDYGVVRGVGSLTFAVAAVFVGRVLDLHGNAFICYLLFGVFLIMAPLTLLMPNPPKDDLQKRVSVGEAARELGRNRRFLFFLACSFVMSITSQSMFAFQTLLIRELGGGQTQVGLALFVIAFSEFWIMIFFTKLRNRFGATLLLGIGMVGYFLKSLIMALAPNVTIAIAAGVLQMVSLGLVIPGAVAYLTELVELRYLASATLLYQSVNSLAQIVGAPIYGIVAEQTSVANMLALFSFPALLAGAVFLFVNRGRLKQKRGQEQPGKS